MRAGHRRARSSTPTGCWPRARACSASRPPRRPWRGCWPRRRGRASASCACSPATGSRTRRRRSRRPARSCRASRSSRPSSRPSSAAARRRRLVRVPASSANLGPGFDVLGARRSSLHVELEVVESGRFAVQTDLRIARDRRNLCVRGVRAPAPGRRLRVPHPLGDPALRRAGDERGGLRRGPAGGRLAVRARRGPARARHRARGPPGQRRGRAARRLRRVRRRRRHALRAARRARGGARRPRPRGAHRQGPRGAAGGGADGRRGVQRRPRGPARARARARRPRPRRPRARRPPPPAAPRAPVPALDGAGRARAAAGRAGRDDLGRRADRARVDAARRTPRRCSSACEAEAAGWAEVRPAPFEARGGTVRGADA